MSLKMTVEWFKATLSQSMQNAEAKRKEIERLQADLKRHEEENLFRAKQIEEAEKRRMVEFDADRLLVKKSKKDFKCSVCGETFSAENDFVFHKKRFHPKTI